MVSLHLKVHLCFAVVICFTVSGSRMRFLEGIQKGASSPFGLGRFHLGMAIPQSVGLTAVATNEHADIEYGHYPHLSYHSLTFWFSIVFIHDLAADHGDQGGASGTSWPASYFDDFFRTDQYLPARIFAWGYEASYSDVLPTDVVASAAGDLLFELELLQLPPDV